MKRIDFVKGIISFMGLTVLPQKMFTRYRRYYLLQSFVRGFRFYEGPRLLDQMKVGDLLELVREANNPYDSKAIALHFNNKKIGFIPKEDNDLLSRLIDADVVPLHAEITHLNKDAREWENVHIGVYIQKETNEPIAANAQYLTVLETPQYRTLKINKDEVASLRYENSANEEIDADFFYRSVIKTRKKNKNQPNSTQPLPSGREIEDLIHQGRIIVNKEKLPKDLQDKVSYALEEGMITLNDFFDENGYVVANINEVTKLSNRVESVIDKIDKCGRIFYEINFL